MSNVSQFKQHLNMFPYSVVFIKKILDVYERSFSENFLNLPAFTSDVSCEISDLFRAAILEKNQR